MLSTHACPSCQFDLRKSRASAQCPKCGRSLPVPAAAETRNVDKDALAVFSKSMNPTAQMKLRDNTTCPSCGSENVLGTTCWSCGASFDLASREVVPSAPTPKPKEAPGQGSTSLETAARGFYVAVMAAAVLAVIVVVCILALKSPQAAPPASVPSLPQASLPPPLPPREPWRADIEMLDDAIEKLIRADQNLRNELVLQKNNADIDVTLSHPGNNVVAQILRRDIDTRYREAKLKWANYTIEQMTKLGVAAWRIRQNHGMDDQRLASEVGRALRRLGALNAPWPGD
jgi:transcription elongation factor Elf1